MAIRKLSESLDIISALDNEPNDEGGLTAAELKAKFDESGNKIKQYINGTLIPDISEEVSSAAQQSGNLPHGGGTGHVLVKKSGADFDTEFADILRTGPEPGTAVLRDGSGRAQVAEPVADADIATKGYVDVMSQTVPDDLAFATQYVWTRRRPQGFELAYGDVVTCLVHSGTMSTTASTIYCADSATVDPDTGKITYGGQSTVSIHLSTFSAAALRGKYWAKTAIATAATVYYSTEDAELSNATEGSTGYIYITGAPVSTKDIVPETEVLYDPDPDAYPHESDDEYEYRYLGKYRDIVPAHAPVVGTYTGDGAASRDISLGFTPRAVFCVQLGYMFTSGGQAALAVTGRPASANNGTNPKLTIIDGGFTVYYVSGTSNYQQMNSNNQIYSWIAWR